ncbi:MAG: hypothetical protein H6838_04095 [Planctomycetes bacterium]|nr:hypothetical protein [Planctomycetota bacterium]
MDAIIDRQVEAMNREAGCVCPVQGDPSTEREYRDGHSMGFVWGLLGCTFSGLPSRSVAFMQGWKDGHGEGMDVYLSMVEELMDKK